MDFIELLCELYGDYGATDIVISYYASMTKYIDAPYVYKK